MKKNNEVTIVTAFFDIGRGNANEEMKRTNEQYVSYFEFWSGIKNNIIVYTEPQYKDKVIEIRKKHGLEDKTRIITIENVTELLPELYEKAVANSLEEKYVNWRYLKHVLDLNPKYDHVMFMKNYFLKDSYDKNYIKTDYVAWLDFGFNHGGRFIEKKETFSVKWEMNNEEKIVISAPKVDDNAPIFTIIQSGEVYVEGGVYVIPKNLLTKFYDVMLESYNSLLDCGLLDDDQTILLMTTRKEKDMFIYERMSCYELVKKYINNEMTIKKRIPPKENLFDKLLYKYRVIKRNRIYLKGIKKSFLKD